MITVHLVTPAGKVLWGYDAEVAPRVGEGIVLMRPGSVAPAEEYQVVKVRHMVRCGDKRHNPQLDMVYCRVRRLRKRVRSDVSERVSAKGDFAKTGAPIRS